MLFFFFFYNLNKNVSYRTQGRKWSTHVWTPQQSVLMTELGKQERVTGQTNKILGGDREGKHRAKGSSVTESPFFKYGK